MQIHDIPIGKLIAYDKNAKIHSDKQNREIANSLLRFGWKQPLVVDRNNVLIVGHGRLEGAKIASLTDSRFLTAPCIIADDLTDEEIKAYRLADNKLNESPWDFDLLSDELSDITALDMSEFGFDMSAFEEEPAEVVEDDYEENLPEEPKAKLGDIYQLGRHRLMCGDSTKAEDMSALMGDDKADMVFTDPPYGVDYKGINNDSRDGLSDLLNGAFAAAMANTKQGGAVYCFHSDKCADIFQDCFRKFCHFSSMIIWKKKTLVLSQTDYQSIHEPCLYGWFDNGTHSFYGDRKQTSVWEFDRESINGHTTPKPIGFIAKALQNSSREGEAVLDVFGGSGSTLIACEQLNRKCYMCELDPHYIDVIIDRWEKFTGQKAVKLN